MSDGTCVSGIEAWTSSDLNSYLFGARFISAIYLYVMTCVSFLGFLINDRVTVGYSTSPAMGQPRSALLTVQRRAFTRSPSVPSLAEPSAALLYSSSQGSPSGSFSFAADTQDHMSTEPRKKRRQITTFNLIHSSLPKLNLLSAPHKVRTIKQSITQDLRYREANHHLRKSCSPPVSRLPCKHRFPRCCSPRMLVLRMFHLPTSLVSTPSGLGMRKTGICISPIPVPEEDLPPVRVHNKRWLVWP